MHKISLLIFLTLIFCTTKTMDTLSSQPMEILPQDILNLIPSTIPESEKCYKDKVNAILPVRLVCKNWNKIAQQILFDLAEKHVSRQFVISKTINANKLLKISKKEMLTKACQKNIAQYVLFVLKNDPELLLANINHYFLIACQHDSLNVVKILSHYALVNYTNPEGNTGLITTCRYSGYQVLSYLLSLEDIQINHVNSHGWSALFFALSNNNKEISLNLLKKGAQYASNDNAYKLLKDRVERFAGCIVETLPETKEELMDALENDKLWH